MYIAGLLSNDTLFKKEDADVIVCAEPVEMKDMPVAEVTPEKLEDYCDPVDSTSETPSTSEETTDITLGFTTSIDTTSFIFSTTKVSVITPESTDASTEVITESSTGAKEVIISSSSAEITSTTESSSVSFPRNEVTETPKTDTTPELTTLFIPKTTRSTITEFTTENETAEKIEAIPVITYPVTEHMTTDDVRTTFPSTSESTTLPEKITSTLHLDKTESTTIFSTVAQSVTTAIPVVIINQTDSNTEQTSQISTEADTLYFSEHITTALPTKKKQDMIRIINYSVSNDTICVTWDIKWEILSKQWITNKLKCGVEIQHSTGKELVYFKNCPTSEHELLECATIENRYLNKMYKFCLNLYISLTKYRSCSKYNNLPVTEKTFKHLSTTELPTSKSLPPTHVAFIPFKVLKFDATFNYEKSFVDVIWLVNRNERNSICTLNLILMSHNLNYTEGVFSCKNNSYKIQNIKHEAFQVCIRTFYQGHYAPLMCESSVPLQYKFSASSMKDDGYKNSAFITIICLLILVVLIIIVILLKKLLKKRSESDLYNVSAEEKNMLRRQASTSLRQDPCVRYSYTVKEQFEI